MAEIRQSIPSHCLNPQLLDSAKPNAAWQRHQCHDHVEDFRIAPSKSPNSMDCRATLKPRSFSPVLKRSTCSALLASLPRNTSCPASLSKVIVSCNASCRISEAESLQAPRNQNSPRRRSPYGLHRNGSCVHFRPGVRHSDIVPSLGYHRSVNASACHRLKSREGFCGPHYRSPLPAVAAESDHTRTVRDFRPLSFALDFLSNRAALLIQAACA